jgi:hypothetical protein
VRVLNILAFACLAVGSSASPIFTSPAVAKGPVVKVCGADSYINVSGHCVHRPVNAPGAPSGASAKCRDGTFSFSEHRQGTCSHHGGVEQWL